MESTLQYHTTMPKIKGWYWFRGEIGGGGIAHPVADLVGIYHDHINEWYQMHGLTVWTPVAGTKAEWWGPLKAPWQKGEKNDG